jgi:hypothetical protein
LSATPHAIFAFFPPMTAGELGIQAIELLLIAIPIASPELNDPHQDVFREPRMFRERCSREVRYVLLRKILLPVYL